MKRTNWIILLVLTVCLGLSFLSGCGSKERDGRDMFVSEDDEYYILDQGENEGEQAGTTSDKKTKKNKKSSSSKDASDGSSDTGTDTPSASSPPADSTPAPDSGDNDQNLPENELPFIPANGSGGTGAVEALKAEEVEVVLEE